MCAGIRVMEPEEGITGFVSVTEQTPPTHPSSPVSDSRRKEADDVEVYHVVEVPVFQDGCGGTPPPDWDRECRQH